MALDERTPERAGRVEPAPRPRGAGVRRLHRTLGLVVALSVVLSTVSGVLHVAMTWTQAPPPAPRPAGEIDAAAVRVGLSEALAAAGADSARPVSASLRAIAGVPHWQISLAGRDAPLYVDASSGAFAPDADARYAAQIASDHLGGAPVRPTGTLTAFDAEYISIFRILPVHRLEADDGAGTRLYVSTLTGSVTRHTDDWRQLEADVFSNLHKLAFIPDKGVRDAVLATLTGGILVAALAGVGLALRTRRRGRGR